MTSARPLSPFEVHAAVERAIARSDARPTNGGGGDHSPKNGELDRIVCAFDQEALLEELAALSPADYDRQRDGAAEQLGIRRTSLDAEIKLRRSRIESAKVSDDVPFAAWRVEPWTEPVATAGLLGEVMALYNRHVVLPDRADVTIALWVLFTWAHDAFSISPLLTFNSPTHRCGKTTALKLLRCLCPRAMPSVNIRGPTLFRAVDLWHPTTLIDEGDNVFDNEELRIVVNAGHDRDLAMVPRCIGDDNRPKCFSTWAPKAVGLIGRMPVTLHDRSITVPIKRKRADERTVRFRGDDASLAMFRRRAARWAVDHLEALRAADPNIPDALNDRAADNWRPLLAIADLAGEKQPTLARDAALTLSRSTADDDTKGIQLLEDLRELFDASKADAIWSKKIIAELTTDPERPWLEYNKNGRPLSQKQLGSLLRPYLIGSETVWIDGESFKGYKRAAFEDAWKRYL